MFRHVVIAGGGFSGTMLAVNLLRDQRHRVTLVERRAEAGRGLAYGSADSNHLLNVCASGMSAFADEPDHFVKWLAARGAGNPHTFAPRPLYGDYLRDILRDAGARAGDRLELVEGSVAKLEDASTGVTASLVGGPQITADAAALALGNLPPHPPRGLDPAGLRPGRYWGDPWEPGVADGLRSTDTVLIIGTGLTMIDMALLLEKRGFKGRILALSRRGLLPHSHAPGVLAQPRPSPPSTAATRLVREVRRRAEHAGWRAAVDELRPFTQQMWRSAQADERARFLRHLRPWWDIHRHRIAPQVDHLIRSMIAQGQLGTAAGKIASFEDREDGVAVTWRPRGKQRHEVFTASRIVNCTGPEGDLPASPEPLLRTLLARGMIRPGWCGMGLDVDRDSRVLDQSGEANPRLFALGPLTRGAFWEIVAVPDIRVQVRDVAARIGRGAAL